MDHSNTSPTVSIVTPVYNTGKLFEETASSILQQDFDSWEWIIVDDGSSEETQGIVRQIGKRDARIHVVFQENTGAPAARNHGLRLARGTYVKFLDADDMLSEGLLKAQVDALRVTGRQIALSPRPILEQTQNVSRLIPQRVPEHVNQNDILLYHLTIGTGCPGALMMARSLVDAVGGWDESLIVDQDGDLVMRVACLEKAFAWVPYVSCIYRDHAFCTRISQSEGYEKIKARMDVVSAICERLESAGQLDPYRKLLALRFDKLGLRASLVSEDLSQDAFGRARKVYPAYRRTGFYGFAFAVLGPRRTQWIRKCIALLRKRMGGKVQRKR